jgi:hypothetical protein
MMGTINGPSGYGNEIDTLGMGFDRMSLGHQPQPQSQPHPQLHHPNQAHPFRSVDHLRHTQPVDKGNRRRGVTKFFNS